MKPKDSRQWVSRRNVWFFNMTYLLCRTGTLVRPTSSSLKKYWTTTKAGFASWQSKRRVLSGWCATRSATSMTTRCHFYWTPWSGTTTSMFQRYVPESCVLTAGNVWTIFSVPVNVDLCTRKFCQPHENLVVRNIFILNPSIYVLFIKILKLDLILEKFVATDHFINSQLQN